jgi:hypothetical protein
MCLASGTALTVRRTSRRVLLRDARSLTHAAGKELVHLSRHNMEMAPALVPGLVTAGHSTVTTTPLLEQHLHQHPHNHQACLRGQQRQMLSHVVQHLSPPPLAQQLSRGVQAPIKTSSLLAMPARRTRKRSSVEWVGAPSSQTRTERTGKQLSSARAPRLHQQHLHLHHSQQHRLCPARTARSLPLSQ